MFGISNNKTKAFKAIFREGFNGNKMNLNSLILGLMYCHFLDSGHFKNDLT